MPIPANASAAGCPTYAVAKIPWAASPDLRHLRRRLDRIDFEPATAIARSAHHEDGGPVEHTVERAEQGLVPREELIPGAWRHVARGDHGVGALLLVATFDYVEEEVGARTVENASPDLVHEQAGRRRRCRQRPRVPRKSNPSKVLAPSLAARRAPASSLSTLASPSPQGSRT